MKQNLYSCALRLCVKVCVQHILPALKFSDSEGKTFMIKISLCMIVKNEAAILSRCLDSVCDLMDEIIIVDTGSTDDTKAVAAKYTDRIYDFAWNNDFSAARN